jgi:hypothetical protein
MREFPMPFAASTAMVSSEDCRVDQKRAVVARDGAVIAEAD